ncbi:hypothetical protein AOA12_18870 [Microbacterium sp. No. 7]|nr:hypothetical protein AOA12_18870 [Microbacterium sp. No. 7]
MNRLIASAAALTLGIAALTSCGSDDAGGNGSEDGGGDTEVFTLTTIMPMSGPGAVYGEGVVRMLDIVVDETNAAGGITIGDTTYEIVLDVLDDELKPETAQAVARQAIDDGAQLIFGPFGSGNANAVQPVMARGGAAWLLPIATVVGPTANPNVFRTAALVSAFVDPELEYIEADPTLQKVALLTDQTHTAHSETTSELIGQIEGIGRSVVFSQDFSTGDTDFRAPLTQMLSDAPDVVILRGYMAECLLALQQLRELGSDAIVILNSGSTTAETLSMLDDLSILEDVYQSMPMTSLDPFVAAGNPLAIELLEKLNGESAAADAYVYDAMQVLLAAMSQATDTSADALIAALTDLAAEDVAGRTLNEYRPQAGGLLFENREVDLPGVMVEWIPDQGWTPIP